MKSTLAVGVLVLVLAGCAPIRPAELQASVVTADAGCRQQTWPTAVAEATCFDRQERRAWLTFAPLYMAYYERIRDERDALAKRFDGGEVSAVDMKEQWAIFMVRTRAALEMQVSGDDARRRAQADQIAQALFPSGPQGTINACLAISALSKVSTANALNACADAVTPAPAPTARCKDGSLSYSAHHQGTCSYHGGVAVWYN